MMRRSLLAGTMTVALILALLPGLGGAAEHEDSTSLSIYLLLDQQEAGPYLVPVERSVDGTAAVAEAAVISLLDGPTDAEAASGPAVSSSIPDGVTLNGISIDGGLATVDLSSGFEAGGGSFAMLTRLAQLVFTVTQFDTVDGMALELDGAPITVFSSEGIEVTPPIDRSWFDGTGVLPPVLVDTPRYGGTFDARLVGTAAADAFSVEILDGDGRLLGAGDATVDPDDSRAGFDVTVPYLSLVAQFGSVLVEDPDDPAASLREYPVTLEPTPVPVARGIVAGCPPAEVPASPFTDVAAASVHATAIDCIAWREITQGRSPTMFEPAGTVTRGQLASMLARAISTVGVDLPADPDEAFTDVAGTTHARQIDQLAALDVVTGRQDGTYAPGAPVTRGQMASLLVRTFEEVAGFELDPQRDYFADDAGSVHEAAVNASALAGLTTGVDHDQFAPSAPLRRDQMATFMARLIDLLVVEGAALIVE
jgi:hypothetical protein